MNAPHAPGARGGAPSPTSVADEAAWGRPISRRRAIPLIGLALVAVGSCDFEPEPLAPDGEADDWLTRARIYPGGTPRFSFRSEREEISVRIEPDGKGPPGAMTVTVLELPPPEPGGSREPRTPRILEVHRGITVENLGRIESSHLVFYYFH